MEKLYSYPIHLLGNGKSSPQYIFLAAEVDCLIPITDSLLIA